MKNSIEDCLTPGLDLSFSLSQVILEQRVTIKVNPKTGLQILHSKNNYINICINIFFYFVIPIFQSGM